MNQESLTRKLRGLFVFFALALGGAFLLSQTALALGGGGGGGGDYGKTLKEVTDK